MGRWLALPLLITALVGGCARVISEPRADASAEPPDASAEPPDARPEPPDASVDTRRIYSSWGAYAASLPGVPPCGADLTLVVDTTGAELDGGATLDDPALAGEALSFFEALTIAANRSERVAILFDAQIFSADAPATITFDDPCTLPDVENTCIDGRDRGVIVDFGGNAGASCSLTLRQDALLVGLELRNLSWQVVAHAGSQIAGCRFNSDGFDATPAREPETLTPTGDALIGPGNTFGNTEGIRLKYGGMAHIFGNYFGVDPVTGADLFNQFGVRVGSLPTLVGTLRIEDNVFRSNTGVELWMGLSADSRVEIVGNRFERGTRDLALSGWRGINGSIGASGAFAIGPGNTFEGLDRAVTLTIPADIPGATITRNTITDCAETIVLSGATVAPPAITSATATSIQGSCSADGLVELFADDVAGQAGRFVGDASCSGGAWRLDAPLAEAYVTATLTTADGTSQLTDAAPVQP